MANTLRIVTWNANGLIQHKLELENFLQQEKIDVILISETHFTNKSVFNLRGYRVYSTEHPSNKARGGTAIIIRASIQYFELPRFTRDYFQATSVSIAMGWCRLTVSAAYCPPRYKIDYQQFVSYFNTLGSHYIAGGDFNSKHTFWGSRLISPKGRQLMQAINLTNTVPISTGKPTYWLSDRARKPDLLDFFLTKGFPSQQMIATELLDLSSDHLPVMLTIASGPIYSTYETNLTSKRTDWEMFRSKLDELINLRIRLHTPADVEEAVTNFINSVCTAAKEATPVTNTRITATNTVSYPREVRELVAEKRRARHKWQINRNPQDKATFNYLCRKLRSKIKEINNNAFQSYLESLSPTEATDYSLWKATK